MTSSPATPVAPVAWYSGSVSRALQPRRALTDIVLEGGHATWHAAARWIVCAFAALTALLVVTETHQVCEALGSCDADDWGATHSLVSDLGASPFVLLGLVVAFQVASLRMRLIGSVLTSIGAAIVSVYALATIGLVHFLSHVSGGGSAAAFALVVFLATLAQILLAVGLAVGQRRALEARDPVFPHAAVVR